MRTCWQCGSWSVAGHNRRKVIGWDPICVSYRDMGLDLSVHQRPCMTREMETWLSDSRVGSSSVYVCLYWRLSSLSAWLSRFVASVSFQAAAGSVQDFSSESRICSGLFVFFSFDPPDPPPKPNRPNRNRPIVPHKLDFLGYCVVLFTWSYV